MGSEQNIRNSKIICQIVSSWGKTTEEQCNLVKNNLQVRVFQKNEIIYREH